MPDYLVTTKLPAAEGGKLVIKERLVRAKNQAHALRHVVNDTVFLSPATIDDAMRIAGDGGQVELAADEAA
jgi:hypothetical protein